jgi:hypothetical protein
VQTPEPLDGLGTRPEHQVVGVGEDDLGPDVRQILDVDPAHRRPRADRHEPRGQDGAVPSVQDPGAGRSIDSGDFPANGSGQT